MPANNSNNSKRLTWLLALFGILVLIFWQIKRRQQLASLPTSLVGKTAAELAQERHDKVTQALETPTASPEEVSRMRQRIFESLH